MTMKKELRDAWVARLRDPANKQYHRQMFAYDKNNTATCCLGQLCIANGYVRREITGHEDETAVRQITDPPYYYQFVKEIIGIKNKDYCIEMNDRLGKSFIEIADWIEANISVED